MDLFLAPIQGMTTACYRNSFSRIFGGIDKYYSPFIATSEMEKVNLTLFKDLLPENNDSTQNVIPQLLSNNGTDFRTFAAAIVSLGYKEINWNIGCPYPTVTSKKKGSGILPYPDMIRKVLDIACSDSNFTLTVKTRLGLENLNEGVKVIEALNEYPLGGVIIHARTGLQMYKGKVDLDSFETLASMCKHEITYSGDIFTYDDYIKISSRFPNIKKYMLGRGALYDPFLPLTIKGHVVKSQEKIKMIKQLHDEVFNYYKSTLSGDKHLCDKMKEFWIYLSVHTDKDGKLFKKIKKSQRTSEYLNIVNPILSSVNGWSDIPLCNNLPL